VLPRGTPFLTSALLLAAASLAAPGGLALAQDEAAPFDARALPTVVELWRWEGANQSLLSGADLLFVAGKGKVTAIEPASGEVAWSTAIGTEAEDCGCGHGAHVHVDDRLFVPIADSIAVVDTDDGSMVTRVPLGGTVHRVVGPPVVAEANPEGRTILVRFDEKVGIELARLELGETGTLERFGDRFTTTLQVEPEGGGRGRREPTTVVIGLDEHLQITWRRELAGWWNVERRGDLLFLEDYGGETGSRRRLDPRTGEMADEDAAEAEESRRLTCDDGSDEPLTLAHEGAGAGGRGPGASVSRDGVHDWTVELPGSPEECVAWGERLLLRLDRGTSRQLLAVVRARSGELEALRRLPAGVSAMLVAAGRPVLETGGALVGIDPLAAGEPEASTHTVAQSVEALLVAAETAARDAIVADLVALGPEALPVLVAALPGLDGEPLMVAAQVLGEAAYEPAARGLAAALDRVTTSPAAAAEGAEEISRWRQTRLATHLAAVAGPQQVSALAPFVDPEWGAACAPALAALGRIGSPAALAAIDRSLAARPASGAWYRPPAPPRGGPMTAAAARAAFEAMVESDGDHQVYVDALGALRSVELAVGAQRWLLFPSDGMAETLDLWVAERPAAGAAATGNVHYLGSLGPCGLPVASVRDDILEVSCASSLAMLTAGFYAEDEEEAALMAAEVAAMEAEPQPAPRSLRLPVGAWRVDTDRDGIGDPLEAQLGLDPRHADSDGDGRRDPDDPAPLGRERGAGDEGALLSATLEAIWLCSPGEGTAPLYVDGAPALEWRGRSGVTLPVPAAGPPAGGALLKLADEREMVGWEETELDVGPVEPDERRVGIVFADEVYGESAPRAVVVMRRTGGRWVARRIATYSPYFRHHY
jgi:hypothetical protein